jgi:hypothetical protein
MWYYKLNCNVEFDSTPEQVTEELTLALEGNDGAIPFAEVLTGTVEEIIASGSFQEETYSGGDTTKFVENLDVVINSLDNLGAKIEFLEEGATESFDAKIALIKSLLEIIKSATEGV